MKPKRLIRPTIKPRVASRQSPSPDRRVGRGFPIVGVGASAGGLEAFTQLLKHLPLDTGFGFVLVQHLDPQHASALTQLLARTTLMPVREATHNLRVEPNHVYVIPPNTGLVLIRGVLKLQARAQVHASPRVIDLFFEALAQDCGERAIGVILSGNANDGTLGLEAIKAAGGLTLAQDDSARYESMPRSAVAAGCVDLVLSAPHIARELARIAKHPLVADRALHDQTTRGASNGDSMVTKPTGRGRVQGLPAAGRIAEQPALDGYRKILLLLRNQSGVDFSLYKPSTIRRRIARRMVLGRQATLDGYAGFLRGNTKEIDALHSDALISVTSFFRNPGAFEVLRRKVFPQLLEQSGDEPLRVWVLGCSTGQEAYSIAMAFAEVTEKNPRARRLQVFATDVKEANLDRARHGLYAKSVTQDVSPERLRRFFIEEEGGYRVIKPLREMVVFARQNVISDPPFSRIDLISCRNVMIYLEPSLQKKVIPTFHYALKPGGFLLLGASESVGGFTDLFDAVDKKHKVFTKKAAPTAVFQLPIRNRRDEQAPQKQIARAGKVTAVEPEAFRSELSAEREADRVTVNQFAPPAVLINAGLQVVQFRGPTGAYLEPPTGRASFDVLKMAREGLMLPLRTTIHRAMKEQKAARTENVAVVQEGRTRAVNIEVVPLKNLKERCFLVMFEDAVKPPAAIEAGAGSATPGGQAATPRQAARKTDSGRIVGLERDLAETRDYLQSIQEQQEAANEELQASNEEGQSANEELQSLNEELETSKEELESTNEELTTVNEEMASRNTELNRLNSDLTNLQTSAKLTIVLLGRDLVIRRFSTEAEKRFGLLASDAGRTMGAVRHNLQVSDLDAIIAGVIAGGREDEREVQDRGGRWYSLRVRPYLTVDHKVDGAVLVLMDIDELKRTERLIIEAHEHEEAVNRTVPNPLLILTADFRLASANNAFNRTFKTSAAELVGRSIFSIDRGSWNIPRLRHLLEEVIPKDSCFDDFEVTHTFERIGRRSLLLNGRILNEAGGKPKEILLGIQDITDRKVAEEGLREVRAELSRYVGKLEKRVAERTQELTSSNHRLETAVESTRRGKEEFRTLFLASQVMQEKLRQLARQVLSAQEDERRRISRELHDSVVQMLVGINVELAALGRSVTSEALPLRAKISRTQRLVEKSVSAVHQFARELRPAVLDDLGLIPALQAFMKTIAARNKLKIRLTAFAGVESLDNPRRTVLYRVAQEALTNVTRHAHATVVDVTITEVSGKVRMEVHDNGRSFVVARALSAKTNQRLGLLGMRERVEMVGGTVSIESAPGKGSTIRAEVPFRRGGAK